MAFFLSGSMFAAYGFGILVLFAGHKSREEKEEENSEGHGGDDGTREAEARRDEESSA